MACAGCGTGGDGKPSGCKSNGGCSTGGCNRLNVFDWLSNIPLGDSLAPFDIIEVSFNNGSRKDFYRNVTKQLLDKGEMVTVEGVSGFDVGTVSLTGELVKLQMKKRRAEDTPEVKKVLRRSSNDDLQRMSDNKSREKEALIKSRALARNLGLEMKLAEVEIQADGRKATFFYTADDRVDFRELIKVYASEFRAKVEMRQIGARQEAGKVGGIGSCGRELCCSTWLSDFKSVNTTAARYQNLSINQAKLSGQCGRLKCCLNYELDTYLDALKEFPDDADCIETAGGVANLQKRDIFKSLMWYSYEGSNKQYPLTITRAKEIRLLNRQGIKPDDLKPVEVLTAKPKETDLGFADVVGQISLKSLEKTAQKRKQKDKDNRQKQQKTGEQKQPAGPRSEQEKAEPKAGQRPDNRQQQERKPKQEGRSQRQNQGGQSRQNQGGQPRQGQGGQPRQGREQQPRQEGPKSQQNPGQPGQQQAGQGGAPKQDRRPPRNKPRPNNPNNPNNNTNK
ncbi:regulatory iron-sulfur-containing complex subunit RicT [Chitinophaga sp. MM2321]|uniref:PSP1 domain-containing protein n=1 Tax=Chitinophaga sp. MM2321 TaxID=3137178 RepID=UPI0032D58CC6